MAKFRRSDLVDMFSHPLRSLLGICCFLCLVGGLGKFCSGDLIMGYGMALLSLWMAGKFVKAQRGILDTLPAKKVACALLIYQIVIPVDMVMNGNLPTFSYYSRAKDIFTIAISLLPTVFAVPLLLKAVKNKPKTIAVMLLILQLPLLAVFLISVFENVKMGLILTILCLPFLLMPLWIALDLLKKSKLMNAAERSTMI